MAVEKERNPLASADHTQLWRREDRIWEVSGFALPGGLAQERLVAAAGVGLAAALPIFFVVWFLFTAASGALVAGIAAVVLTIGAYFVIGQGGVGELTIRQRVSILLDFWFRQPKRLSGGVADREPRRAHWQVIVWTPTDPDWFEAWRLWIAHTSLDPHKPSNRRGRMKNNQRQQAGTPTTKVVA